ncbi:hypothetical protein DW352_05200 [Pseudolabrys taiwanensis]|uniref:Uncharacterized protein n=1 Tax=Pseudolabrys taiwanensis TaxID=331696 RepID=A0A345ZSR9_9HYPH|nr:hypothetical protein DW352_05200 [Pseudolabrys taiwanensis]
MLADPNKSPDPAFAAIERYREARRALAEDVKNFPGRDVDEDLTADEIEAVDEMLLTRPATLQGCAALLREIAAAAENMGVPLFDNFGGIDDAGRDFLPMLAAFIEATASGGTAVRS